MTSLWIRRFTCWLALLFLLLIARAQPVYAHAELIQADPPPNAVLSESPRQIILFFDEAVDPNLSYIAVLDDRQLHHEEGIVVSNGDAKSIRIAVGTLPHGSFIVEFQVLSAADSHVTRGNYSFAVGSPSTTILPTLPVSATSGDFVSIALRWLDLLAILILAGALYFRSLVLIPLGKASDFPLEQVDARWRQILGIAFLIGLQTELLSLLDQARIVTNVLSPATVSQVLFETRFGFLWITRWTALLVIALLVMGIRRRISALVAAVQFLALLLLYLGVLSYPGIITQIDRVWAVVVTEGLEQHFLHVAPLFLFVILVVARDRTTRRLIAVALTSGMLLTFSLNSHAVAQGNLSLAVLLDWLHLNAAAAWVGGLVTLSFLLVSDHLREDNTEGQWVAALARRFSPVAIASVIFVALTGLYSASQQTTGLAGLLSTLYGQVLYAKVILFLVLVAFGSVQLYGTRRYLVQRTTLNQGVYDSRTFRRLAGSEVLVGALIIGAAALLSQSAPARSSIAASTTIASSLTGRAPLVFYAHPASDVDLKLNLQLASPDQTADAFVTDSKGKPASVTRVTFEFILLDQNSEIEPIVANATGIGHYSASGNFVSGPGMWDIRTTLVREAGGPLVVSFPFYTPGSDSNSANDPAALGLLTESDAVMNRLKSLRSTQYLNDGINAVVTTLFEYQAPDRLRFTVNGGAESIAIGSDQYYRQNDAWTVRSRVNPVVFPDFANAHQSAGVRLGREMEIAGAPAQVVLARLASSPDVEYAYWVSEGDRHLVQLAMVATSHYMVQTYYDFDGVVDISAPR